MKKIEKVQMILKEINTIEKIIKPYEFYTADVPKALNSLAAIRESLKDPEKADLNRILEKIREGESMANRYRGYEPAEEVIRHIEEIKRLLTED